MSGAGFRHDPVDLGFALGPEFDEQVGATA
jgi:hypothetical protein